ncbi:hypothetical protein KOI35_42620 [Actinoplanes bogorensis]|uniref:Gp5/Type VI secretion system Vgr protein OB-fold domain-containing protein n=1 Tax=Paractinoplanes bogorensis TaxID=1610840 RepID=A0ABS5Z3V1_9ACTN|nr:hypothetical protein [Actinoplanes bogorensis]MBU2670216.1 hypothetical protein [Actinoplanes bogorensis]
MGFVIWFQVSIEGAGLGGLLPLRISNDVFGGEYVLDADITVDLISGAAASTFTVVLTSLPADVVDTLKTRHAKAVAGGEPAGITIGLGYFDDPAGRADPLLRGVLTSIRTSVGRNGDLITTLRGLELAGYKLLKASVAAGEAGDHPLTEAVRSIAAAAGDLRFSAAGLPTVKDFSLHAGDGLQALREVAQAAEAPLVIGNEMIRIGPVVGTGEALHFTADDNIVELDHVQEDPQDLFQRAARSEPRTAVEVGVLGDPRIRPGMPVILEPGDPRDAPAGTLRVEQAHHVFDHKQGYTCRVGLVVAEAGRPASRTTGADGVADRIRDVAESVRTGNPAIDVGEVAAYHDKHLADLRYGQTPKAATVAPSVETPVDDTPQLHNRPMSSPFAFHRCGLVVPVLPGMRALLAHNRGLVNDAVVAGFLWPEKPTRYQPPKNKPGDWWLCLPTELDGKGLPTGKGVGDLTDATGRRVMQAKGLRITVGAKLLPEVGDRPDLPEDGELVIEHSSGTKVTVDKDGAVVVDSGGKTVTLKSGSATITLDDGKITLSGSKVEVS